MNKYDLAECLEWVLHPELYEFKLKQIHFVAGDLKKEGNAYTDAYLLQIDKPQGHKTLIVGFLKGDNYCIKEICTEQRDKDFVAQLRQITSDDQRALVRIKMNRLEKEVELQLKKVAP